MKPVQKCIKSKIIRLFTVPDITDVSYDIFAKRESEGIMCVHQYSSGLNNDKCWKWLLKTQFIMIPTSHLSHRVTRLPPLSSVTLNAFGDCTKLLNYSGGALNLKDF